ncbi:S53 family peptidase [Tunturiibacter lichenicola]|uniref:S53 family peptidase n=1 Tax=Tunturiibacter lichenicola TaxID=2051959 RepID=UPI003D9AE0F0
MRFQSFVKGAATGALVSLAAISTVYAQVVENNVSTGIRYSADLGPVNPSTEINLTVHLKLPRQTEFDKAVEALYDPTSPTFHKWMTDADLKTYAPTGAQIEIVRRELEKQGLTILSTDTNGFTIRVRGAASSVARAFNTQINQFRHNGKVFRANIQNAQLSGEAGQYVSTVAGLESHQAHPLVSRAIDPKTKQFYPSTEVTSSTSAALSKNLRGLMTDQCLSAPTAFDFQSGTPATNGVYFGNVYMQGNQLLLISCDYNAASLQAAYGLTAAYKKGLDGTGQTIVLVEAYGDSTIEKDANVFSNLMGLPALTSSNFQIVYPEGQPANPNAGVLTGWNTEIALDVDWAHAMAPGAKIVVVVTTGQDSEDFQDAIRYVVSHKLGNSVSNSYEIDTDLIAGSLEQKSWDQTLEVATAKGISVNFSTGDSGDEGLGTPVGAAGVPSVSPHATAVGGTSILNQVGSSTGTITTGWGSVGNYLMQGGIVQDPPAGNSFFVAGSGGGESIFFPKPSWQKALPGTGRQTPDVSALADPYTGVPIVLSDQFGVAFLQYGFGGTSLASPIFSAFWAIANQKAGKPLGQAAPAIAALPKGDIQDVLPTTPSTVTNPAGVVFDQNGSNYYSAANLFSGALDTSTGFTSAIWPFVGGDTWAVIGFGIDTSLTVTPGWDNVTGYGTPNGLTFINAVAAGK